MINDKIVMVLDDEPGVAQYCREALERAGLEVLPFVDARRAVGVLHQANVDLLLVDIRMPLMDGFQVMEKARELQPDIAILVMTGFGTMETATRALRTGANGLILKPFSSTQELVEDVRRALDDRDNKREFSRLQALGPLLEITEGLFSKTEKEELVNLILDSVTDLLKCEHAGFYQTRARPDEPAFLELVEARGKPLPGEPAGFGGGPIARADAWGAPFRVDPGSLEDPAMLERVANAGLSAVLCAPALRGSGENSVILAGRGAEALPFSDADAELFSILATQARVALENARLYSKLLASLAQVEEQQEALRRAEKMAAIGRLTASIAHEVNNPLQAVRNCLHLATRDELSPEKRRQYLALAEDELQRLMDTVHLMLDFYRPGKRGQEETDLNELIRNVLTLLDNQFQQGRIQVKTDFEEGLPVLRLAPNPMKQVFFNVLINAMEAMPDGGTVGVSTTKSGRDIIVLVEDTGSGVPRETRDRLFEPFVSSKPNGTGLGLSVSYSILNAHGGSIELVERGKASQPGSGAVFKITLPGAEVV